jgi:uracil-DNA glycosylase family protein
MPREVVFDGTLEGWRRAARGMIAQRASPEEIVWRESLETRRESPGLFDPPAAAPEPEAAAPAELTVPRAFLALAQTVAASREPERWRWLYSVLWRIAEGDRDLLLRRDDPDLRRLRRLAAETDASGAPEGAAAASGAGPFIPVTADLSALAAAAASCRGCDLYRHATQTVFGRGPASARAVLVGEAPGDSEDRQGAPFVGPAGEVLDRALVEAGLSRDAVYVTNAVKHFKFVRTPTRRLHQTPDRAEIEACRPWLAAELAILRPRVLVCLGTTASKALLGPDFRLMKERGKFLQTPWAPKLLATFHPSAVLRAQDEAGQARVYRTLVADLGLAAAALAD